jgi:uncharacterized protein (TIGR01370 family)
MLRGNIIGDIVPIRFWTDSWLIYLKQRIDEIINSGFNGIYIDYTDLWNYWSNSQSTAATDMRALLVQISNYIKVLRALPNFKIVVAGFQWNNDADYVNCVDGILCHNIFYEQEQAVNTTLNAYYINMLNVWSIQHKKVIVVEQLTNEALISHFTSRALGFGFVPCVI